MSVRVRVCEYDYDQLTFFITTLALADETLIVQNKKREDVPLRIIDVQADHGAVRDHFVLILEQPRPRSRVVLTYSRWTPAHRGDSAEAVVSDCDGALLIRDGLWHSHRQIRATQDLLLAVAYVVAFCHVARAHAPCCHAAPRVRWSQGPRIAAEKSRDGEGRRDEFVPKPSPPIPCRKGDTNPQFVSLKCSHRESVHGSR